MLGESEKIIVSPQEEKDPAKIERSEEERVLADLGLTWDDLSGKRVLDMGAGLASLAQEGKKHGVEIFSLERFPEDWRREGTPPKDLPYVVGDAAEMPFKDKSFDMIISHAAPPASGSESPVWQSKVLGETRRVLKDDGEFRFGPGHLLPEEGDEGPEEMNEMAQWLKEQSLRRMRQLDWEGEARQREGEKNPFKGYYILKKSERKSDYDSGVRK